VSEQATADELAVRQLAAACADAVSRCDRQAFGSLWAPDGRWSVPGLEDAVGGEAAADRLVELLGQMEFMLQFLQGGQVWIDGDRARARWYITEIGRTAAGAGVYFAGVYDDELVRTDAGWRFALRRYSPVYRGSGDFQGKAYPAPPLER
jgi:SnoaL-like domain